MKCREEKKLKSMEKKLYFITSEKGKVMFRNHQDFVCAINKLAVIADLCNCEVWAYVFNSNHFHFFVECTNVKNFISRFKCAYLFYFKSKYFVSGVDFKVGFEEIPRIKTDIVCSINYILKNPVHHGYAISPFLYAYSSCFCYLCRTPKVRQYSYFLTELG